jgi:hypothetical protein
MRAEEMLILAERKLSAMRDRIAGSVCMGVEEVAAHLGVGRTTVESYPVEVTRCFDAVPHSSRRRLRFSPAEVEAIKVRLRRWERAKARGEGEAYLRALREEMEREEEETLEAARRARRDLMGIAA